MLSDVSLIINHRQRPANLSNRSNQQSFRFMAQLPFPMSRAERCACMRPVHVAITGTFLTCVLGTGYELGWSDGRTTHRDFPPRHNRCGSRRDCHGGYRGERTAVAAVEWLCQQPRTHLHRLHRRATRSAGPASPTEPHREARSCCGTHFSPSRHQGRDRFNESDVVPDRFLEANPRASCCDARSC